MIRAPSTIRTPDQRLRVFVSSTLVELAPERKAVRTAVERLRLAPVMFELGARPHPPRDLYRAYLDQSDVFLGLYWQRYGWVAPSETVSGLEDEYLLSGSLPKLMYVKTPATEREPRLGELLDRIRSDDSTSYKSFTTPVELAELVEGDLATLLAERFDQSRRSPDADPIVVDAPHNAELPAPLTELIGRETEVAAVQRMLRRERGRLVTLTGPGGIGKSRLAIDVANGMADEFTDGLAFVSLAAVTHPELVPGTIALALGVRDDGGGSIEEKLATSLRNRQLLLVIDNFEQVQDAAPLLTRLLAAAPELRLLVTSRAVLRLSGETTFEVGPLALPVEGAVLAAVEESPAVHLFVERARAVKPDFELTPDNSSAVVEICRALDGVPLALELAGAGIRLLTPAAMLARLDHHLTLPVSGSRDMPDRHRTLRGTIDWSAELLTDGQRDLLAVLGAFTGAFSLDAVEAVAASNAAGADVLGDLGVLVDNSLVRQQDRDGRATFTMLSSVREYAREQLIDSGTLEQSRAKHAAYYVELGARIELELEGPRQLELIDGLTDEYDNLRAAVRYLFEQEDWETLTQFAWTLYLFWWIGGHLGEVNGWMCDVLATADTLSDLARAIALYFAYAISFWQDPDNLVLPGLTESAELFQRAQEPSGEALARVSLALAMLSSGTPDPLRADDELESALSLFRHADDTWGEAMALVTLGRVALLQQQVNRAVNRFDEGLAIARHESDDLGTTIALHHLGWAHVVLGDIEQARALFEESLANSARMHHDDGTAYGLEGLVAIAAASGNIDRAGELLGASEALREQKGIYNLPTFSFHRQSVAPILSGEHADRFRAAVARGRRMSGAEATELALHGRSAPAADAAVGAPVDARVSEHSP